MAYERIYGRASPFPCGKGESRPFTLEHDTFPSTFPHTPSEGHPVEIDCQVCDPECKTVAPAGARLPSPPAAMTAKLITHKTIDGGQNYCGLQLDSDERILISYETDKGIAFIRIYKLMLGGLVPLGTIFECAPTEMSRLPLSKRVMATPGARTNPVDAFVDYLKDCPSIRDVAAKCARIAELPE